jgi:ribosomal protein L33
MPEYISREAAKAACGCENAVKYGNETPGQRSKSYSTLMLYEVADAIDDVPAADVVPVVHARWIETPKDGWTRMECSGCGHSYYVPANINPRERVNGRNYCVKCGSRMDGGEPK